MRRLTKKKKKEIKAKIWTGFKDYIKNSNMILFLGLILLEIINSITDKKK